tara:strand:- start:20060 stop:21727 length:1668 start_codon:yes stop_codon:yes gene_type:complete
MHGTAERPYSIERDTKVNKNAPTNKILKLGNVGTFNSLNPYIIKGISPPGIKGLVIESLMNWSPDEPFSLYPGIAEGIKVDKKRTWVEFKINKKAKFSNQEKITPQDIKFSLNILKNYGRPHTRSYYSLVEKIEITSKNSIKFYFKKESNFEMPLIIGLMPILSKKYWEYKSFDKTTLDPFISSGPYLIEKITPGRSITYKKNSNWWNKDSEDSLGRYNFEYIKYDFYRDSNVALEAFLSGEYDIQIEDNAIRWKQAYTNDNIIKKTFPKKSPSGIEAIMFNSRKFPLNDINTREALSLLFPHNFINKIINHNLLNKTIGPWDNSELSASKPASSLTKNILKKYHDTISKKALKDIKINPPNERENRKKSLILLSKSGWKLINRKMTHTKTNEALKIEVITNQSKMEKILLIWKDKLKKIGVTLKIRVIDSAQFQNRLQTFDYDAIIFKYYMSLSPGNEQSIYWGSWASEQNGSRNYSGIKHAAIDEIIEKITNAKNRTNLIEYTKTLDRLLQAGNWMIPLFHDPLHRIAFQKNINIPLDIPLYGFNPWTAWKDN